jgi:uncharacterized phage-associated protein
MKNFELFSERKSAQAAAYLLYRAGGSMALLKLIKLMYLAERESFKRYGDTITGDEFVSMAHGPVLSRTLNLLNGFNDSKEGGWDAWISDRENHSVSLKSPELIGSVDDLTALSETDVECLAAAWERFGHWDKYRLRDYTHTDACPEWEDPLGSSRPIPYARILKAVGHDPDQVQSLSRRLHEQRYISAALD